MTTSIERVRADVQRAFDQALAKADDGGKCTFWQFEKELWTLLLALGRSLVRLFLLRTAQRPRAVEYAVGDARYVLSKERETDLGTRFGKVRFARPTGRKVGDSRAACDLPVDRELGLCTASASTRDRHRAALRAVGVRVGAAHATLRLMPIRARCSGCGAIGAKASFMSEGAAPRPNGGSW